MITGCQEETLKINKTGEFLFRRSYADIQFRDVSAKELDSIKYSNPSLGWASYNSRDSALLSSLKETGVLDNSLNLIRSKFPDTVLKKFTLTNTDGKQVHGEFLNPTEKDTHLYNLVITYKKMKAVLGLEEQYNALNRDISYLLLDLVPGDYPEIVVLNEYYIMNGDNSDIFIYEITD